MPPLPTADSIPLQREHPDAAVNSLHHVSHASDPGVAEPVTGVAPHMFLDRYHTIPALTDRAFAWAVRTDVPLLERLR